MGHGTVVLLHGLGRSSANMLILKWRLQSRGYGVCNVGYDTRAESIEAATDSVFDSIRERGGEAGPVHFVTHSLGGLVLRCLLDRHAIPSAGRAVMLAPPNRGSEIADSIRSSTLARGLFGPLLGQLGTRPQDIPRSLPVPSIPFGIIAGTHWINPIGPFLLSGPHDGTVTVASTRLEGMSDHLVVPHTHTFIMNPPEVARQVDQFLRRGRFDHPASSHGVASRP
jgi:pimeloyl-ACP methyl ester carboxylesterase